MSRDRASDLPRTLLQVLCIGALIAGGFWVLSPFLGALTWATMMVVATWPVLLRVQAALWGRRSLAVATMTTVLLLVLIVPLYLGTVRVVENVDKIGELTKWIVGLASSPPPEWVGAIPLVGTRAASSWSELAASGPEEISERLAPYARDVSAWLLAEAGSLGSMLIQFLLTVGIAAVLYAQGEAAVALLRRFAKRVGGERGDESVRLAGQAVQAVALGVVVTAMIQSALAGIGLAVAGVPFASVLTALIFVLCIAQLGPGLVFAPAIGWMYWQGDSVWATALVVWAVPVTALDGVLRPYLIKRGADLPMMLILPGVIGGLIAFGVLGLFIGPVLLAVGYTLLLAWLDEGETAPRLRSSISAMTTPAPASRVDAVIVGAGFSGLYMLHKLRGLGLRARIFEAGTGVGGTWFWNRYPGARCDVESMEYSFKFDDALQQEWEWSERYSEQPEIMRYLNHVADRFDLRRDIAFETRVTKAHFDEKSGRWNVATDRGESVSAQYCIMATGCLSSTNVPKFPGLDSFAGRVFHTGKWPHEPVDFTGRRVGIVGTGSSAIQTIPIVAQQARHLLVLQRTPNFSVPAQNGPLDPATQARIKAKYGELRRLGSQMPFGFDVQFNEKSALEATDEEREAEFEQRWKHGGLPFLGCYSDLLYDKVANELAADFIRAKIRAIVKDPKVAALLTPDSVVGCKRLCSDTGYFETFNRDNVTLVDVRSAPIEAVLPTGLRTAKETFAFDDLILATGFDAMTGSLLRIDIRGAGGVTLGERWAEGPKTYLGLTTVGFPNLFMMTGPGSPSVLSNMVVSIEQHAEWIADCVAHLRARGLSRIEATPEAQAAWVAHVNEVADSTLYPKCNSWYLGSNVPGKPRVFMPYLGFPAYVEKCKQVVASGYEGFRLA